MLVPWRVSLYSPENGWLEDDISFWGLPIFSGELLVSGRGPPFETKVGVFIWLMT